MSIEIFITTIIICFIVNTIIWGFDIWKPSIKNGQKVCFIFNRSEKKVSLEGKISYNRQSKDWDFYITKDNSNT